MDPAKAHIQAELLRSLPIYAIDQPVWVYSERTAICSKITEIRLMYVFGEYVWCYKLNADLGWFSQNAVYATTTELAAGGAFYMNNKPIF